MITSQYQSPAESAADIRQKLKKLHGITSRQVSVRARRFSMGSAIDVTINDPTVDIREVQNIADCKEKIAICHLTGEILNGGNRYLHVAYGTKAAEVFAATNAGAIARLLAVLPEVNSNTSGPEVEIDGKALIVMRGQNGRELHLRDVGKPCGRPAWIPQPEYLAGANGARAVAESILAMRGGSS